MKQTDKITYDGEFIKIIDDHTVHTFKATQQQLCDILGYDHSFLINKVCDDPSHHEILEIVNGKPFYTWSRPELFFCANSGELQKIDEHKYIDDVFVDLFKSLGWT